MGEITYVRSSFAGGEWSQMAQGRFHDPKYRTALNTCLNVIPVETEGTVRRPGFGSIVGATTRAGAPGRVMKFDFEGNAPYTMEFTDQHLRLISGTLLATTNDSQLVSSFTTANPMGMNLAASVSWNVGDQIYFTFPAGLPPVLHNRLFTIVGGSGASYTLADALTGVNINGAAVGATGGGVIANRVLDIVTPYTGNSWVNLRSVQSDNFALLLENDFAPQALGVINQPNANNYATFGFGPATFNDGPYLDPFVNGARVTPNQTTGIVQLAVSFPLYVATTSYPSGAFVTSSGANYVSLVDQNINNTPASSPSKWAPTLAQAAINGGLGFTGNDIGRLVRLFSEPLAWAVGTTYATGNVVSYNPTGLPGQTTYWGSLVSSNIGNVPGTDLTHWQILELGGQINSPAIWTWGKITGLVNFISTGGSGGGSPSIIGEVGDLGNNGGLAAAFDNNPSKPRSTSASKPVSLILGANSPTFFRGYVGAHFSAGAAIQSVTVVPPNDHGMAAIVPSSPTVTNLSATVYLYASTTAPTFYNNGTLLGSTVLKSKGQSSSPTLQTGVAPVSITSSNNTTLYNYCWIVIEVLTNPSVGGSVTVILSTAQVQIAGTLAITGTSTNGVNVELLGPPLLYSALIAIWRLGVFSNTTGWPVCGTLAEGRIWLAGSIPNRLDSTVANGFIDSASGAVSLTFSPTDQYGNVLDSSGISAVFDAPDANPILWMTPDAQGIIAGTQASEWLISAPSAGGFSPTNIAVRRTTRIGSAPIEPTKTEHTLVFVQKFLRNVMEYFSDVFSGKFTAPKLTIDAKHLTVNGLQEIAYQQELCPILWARVNNGLIGCTYKRDTLMTSQGPTFNGWHRHTLGSGSQVMSICTGSSVNGNLDALTIVSFNPATGFYYVQVLTDIIDEGAGLAAASYLDDAITPTTISTASPSGQLPNGGLIVNGLWPLNGFTVTAWLGGLDCGDYVVSNGSITVPFGDGLGSGTANGLLTAGFVENGITANGNVLWTGTMPMRVGFTYTSTVLITRPVAPEETGARAGPGFGKLRRSHYIMTTLEGAGGVSFGSDSNFFPALFTQSNGQPLTIDQQFTGLFRDQFTAEYNFQNRIGWRVTRPYICNVTAIGASVETADI